MAKQAKTKRYIEERPMYFSWNYFDKNKISRSGVSGRRNKRKNRTI